MLFICHSDNAVFWMSVHCCYNKCSAVAEMVNCLATVDMGRKLEGAVPLWGRGAGSQSTSVAGEWLDILWCSACLSLTFVTFFVKKYFFSAYQL